MFLAFVFVFGPSIYSQFSLSAINTALAVGYGGFTYQTSYNESSAQYLPIPAYEAQIPQVTPVTPILEIPTILFSNETYIFPRYMCLTDSGNDVLNLQIILQNLGYFPSYIAPNGYYGPTTIASVRNFQKAHSIRNTGNVGPLKLEALNQAPGTLAFITNSNTNSSIILQSILQSMVDILEKYARELQAQLAVF